MFLWWFSKHISEENIYFKKSFQNISKLLKILILISMEIFPINIFPWLMAAGTYKHKAVSRMWSVSHLLQTDVSLAGRFYNWWPHCPLHSGLRGGGWHEFKVLCWLCYCACAVQISVVIPWTNKIPTSRLPLHLVWNFIHFHVNCCYTVQRCPLSQSQHVRDSTVTRDLWRQIKYLSSVSENREPGLRELGHPSHQRVS